MANAMINKTRMLYLFLLLLLLVPLGYLAACGVHHTRPGDGFRPYLATEREDFLTYLWLIHDEARFITHDIASEPRSSARERFSTKTIKLKMATRSQNGSWDHVFMENGIGWIVQTNDTSGCVYQFSLTNNEPVHTIIIDFGDSTSADSMILVIDGKLIRRANQKLEMWDALTGTFLDSIAIPPGPKTYLFGVHGTQNVFLEDLRTNFVGLYGSNDKSLLNVQEWKALATVSFQRNDESFVASLLPDGATIEVRNAEDGSVVSSYSVPIDSKLPLPLTSFELAENSGCFRWRSLGLWTDALTGRTLPIPDSFVLFVRDVKSSRLLTIRHETANGMIVPRECVVVDETTGEQLKRFPLDLNKYISIACILKNSGHLALATSDKRVHLYDLETGVLVRTIDPFQWGFPLNCAAAILFGLWCIFWIRMAATVHPYGWIDASVFIGLFVAYASYRFYAELYSPADTLFILASGGVLLASIQLTSIWLCLGRNRLFLRSAPFVLTIGLAAGLVTCWHARQNVASTMVAGIMPLTVDTILALAILRWSGVKFENELSQSVGKTDSVIQKESSINLRELFLFTLVSAIVAAIVRWIPVSYWYGELFDRRFLAVFSIFAICLAAVVVMSLWTSFSRRNIVVRWLPWLVALALFQWVTLGALDPLVMGFVFGSFATLMIGLHAYRLRGWRFREK